MKKEIKSLTTINGQFPQKLFFGIFVAILTIGGAMAALSDNVSVYSHEEVINSKIGGLVKLGLLSACILGVASQVMTLLFNASKADATEIGKSLLMIFLLLALAMGTLNGTVIKFMESLM